MKKSLSLFLFSLLPLCGGELLRNGGFEKPGFPDFRFRRISKSPLCQVERSSVKVKSGSWSLRSFSADSKIGPAVEMPRLLTVPGKKYRFRFAFFVASREEGARISARFAFVNKSGKVIRYMFPVFKSTPGEWHTPEVAFFPPVDSVFTGITLWLNGRQTVYLDDFSLTTIEEKEAPNIHAGALSLQENAECTIWKEAPYLKVPASGVPDRLKKGGTVTLSAAANESEPFQIVVSPKKDLADVTLSFSSLKGKNHQLPASVFSWKKVGFINLKNPDNPAMKGLNADPLFPEVRSAAVKGQNLPFFVRVNVPPHTPAGIYTGEFQLLNGTRSLGRFGLKLRVFDFELPQIPHLKTYFYARPFPAYNMWDKRSSLCKAENFHKIMHEHRMTGNQALFPPNPKWHIKDGKLTITDWSAFDKEVERRHKLYGQTNFAVPTWTTKGFSGGWAYTGGSGDKPGKSPYGPFNLVSPEGLKYAGQYAAEFSKHVEKKFPHLDFFAYIFDEPPAKVYADLKKLLDAIHAAAPKFKVFITKNVSNDVGHVHTFCVPLAQGYVDFARHAEHKKNGGRIWYYNWRVNLGNHGYISNRLYPWQVYAADGSGALLWGSIHTNMGINPWTDLDRTYNCGAATIFYPPRRAEEGNIPSQRAAMIREGIDDFDYMQILEKLIDSHYPGAGRQRVMEIVRELIPVPPFKFVNDPHLLARIREDLACETEEFKKLPVVLLSQPVPNTQTELAAVRFKLLAPAGAKVTVDGRAYGTVQGKKPMEIPLHLKKLGKNTFRIEVAAKGKKRILTRNFELLPDPLLKELAQLAKRAKADKFDVSAAENFLKSLRQGKAYTAAEQRKAAELTGKLKYLIADKSLKQARSFVNPLEKFCFDRAREVFKWKQFERSEYYLALAAEAAKFGSMKNFKVKVTPVEFKGHSAIALDNGIVRAVILETGATVVSFKVNGVETLQAGAFNKLLPPRERAARKVHRSMITRLWGYDGYSDADGIGIWPVSFVDWNIKFKEVSPNKVSIRFETPLPGKSFLFSRTLTMSKDSADLVMDYEICNQLSADAGSDDPEHFQLPWRGRAVPAIGSGKLPQLDDTLVVPGKFPAHKLAPANFNTVERSKQVLPSVRLKHPFLGAFDTKLRKGIVFIGGAVTSHGSIWFDSKGNKEGKGRIYTLELPRSYFGRKYDDKEPNSPLSIPPGKTLNFTVTLRGLSHVTDAEDLIRQAGF